MIDSDCIELEISLCASRDQVWDALTDAANFGTWFGVAWEPGTAFLSGSQVVGRLAPTNVHPAVARRQKAYFGMPVELTIDRIEAKRRFTFRWRSYAWEATVAPVGEATTLVVFELHTAGARTNLTITESGFDRLPLDRRVSSTNGWARQAPLLEKFLAGARDLRTIRD